ncbi:AI-2E family transporter [Devosia pacifica]|uniref:AI-2E family transporter n=1 Tax=Devosia pacifica TaxID=1335967 RepID=A0A918VQ87_9HYPH|nr:AI-2E family transporter [Devosia pacifica]GHA16183.1 AI-2E family transporter [Devosia pacifica]
MSNGSGGVPAAMSGSQFERVLSNISRMAIILVGAVIALVALQAGRVIIAPVFLAIVIGLMFGPAADKMENRGVPPALSAATVVLSFLIFIGVGLLLFSMPLSEWVARAPAIWRNLQAQVANLQEPLESIGTFQEQFRGLLGNDQRMEVSVEDNGAVTSVALLAPSILAQIGIFLASLYFFLATRDHIRISVLSLCISRRMRWRTAHIFRDVEHKVSRYLLSITAINVCVGVAVTLVMWAIGMPSPLLWGALAAVLNYIPYVGQATMWVILIAVGLGTQTGLENILLPVGCYMAINFLEGQLLTPHLIGRTMTLNPFIIFLSITFWLWAWGPVGGLIAVPALLIGSSIMSHALPGPPSRPKNPVRTSPTKTAHELVLENAGQAVREEREPEAEEEKRKRERMLPPEGTAPSGVEEGGR